MEPSIDRLRLSDVLTVCVIALLGLGVIMVQSAAMNVASRWTIQGTTAAGQPVTLQVEAGSREAAQRIADKDGLRTTAITPAGSPWAWNQRGTKHAMFAGLGLLTFLVVSRIDYARLLSRRRYSSPAMALLGIAIFTCFAVLVPHVGMEVNGARRWLPLGIVQVQPSEIGKWAVVVFLAWWLASEQVNIEKFFGGLLATLLPVGIICLLIVIQDFGTAALIGLCTLLVLLAARARLWHLMLIIPPALAVAFWFVRHKEYRWRRMTAFLDPFAAPRAEGYHMIQSLLSFATGGIFGKGLGNGVQKLGYLPEDTTDFIFAVICEELGLFGAILTISLYMGIVFVAWQIIRQQRDTFGRLLAFGIGSMIGLQALINIAVATVSVPTKGLSLPLISAGGSGLVITCAALGLLSSICRHQHATDALGQENWSLTGPELAQAM